MGFNSRFTTKPAGANSAVTKPLEAKPFLNGVDEYEVEEQTPPGSTDRSRQSEASYTDDSGVSSPRLQDWERRKYQSWLQVASYCFYLVLSPRYCLWVLSVDRRSCSVLCSSVKSEAVEVVDAVVCAWIKSEANATVTTLIMFSLTRSATFMAYS